MPDSSAPGGIAHQNVEAAAIFEDLGEFHLPVEGSGALKAGPLPAQLVGEFLRYRAGGAVGPRGGFPQLPVNGQCVQGVDQRPIILGTALQARPAACGVSSIPGVSLDKPASQTPPGESRAIQPADQRVAAFHVGVDRGERLVLHGGVDRQAELREHHGDGILVHAKDAVFGDVAFPLRIGAAVVELFAQSREIIHAFDEKVTAAARGVQAGEFPRFPLGIERQRAVHGILDEDFVTGSGV